MIKDLEAGTTEASELACKKRNVGKTASSAKSLRSSYLSDSEVMAMLGHDGEDFQGYVRERKVGSGGQGNCWLVTQEKTGCKYILKVRSCVWCVCAC